MNQAKHRIISVTLALCLLLTMVVADPGAMEVRAALPDADEQGKPWDGSRFKT